MRYALKPDADARGLCVALGERAPRVDAHGLIFVSFGRSLDAFEVQLRRMLGLDDGIVDALFRFTRPVTGGYNWCPPIRSGRLDLRVLLD